IAQFCQPANVAFRPQQEMAEIGGFFVLIIMMRGNQVVFIENPSQGKWHLLVTATKRASIHSFPPFFAVIFGKSMARASFTTAFTVHWYPIIRVLKFLQKFLERTRKREKQPGKLDRNRFLSYNLHLKPVS